MLDDKDTVQELPVTIGQLQSDGLRVVQGKGLDDKTRVVVSKLLQVRPKTQIQPVLQPMPTYSGADPAPAAQYKTRYKVKGKRKDDGCYFYLSLDLYLDFMLARFFIDRPIFATVVSVVITLCGGIAMVSLPIAQYPQITPPSVSLSISYPGANAQVVQDTIAAPIEQAVNGVQGMLYMSSTSGSDGSYSLSITFEVGTNLNTALVMVQNRVALALPLLPTAVQSPGNHRPQEIAGPVDDHQLLLQRRKLHRPRSEQFRPHQSQG